MKNIVTTSQIADFFIKKTAEAYEQFEEKYKDADWFADWVRSFSKHSSSGITYEENQYMEVTKLQSLLGYAYAWHLALKGEKLFDEKMYACERGYFFHSQNQRFSGELANVKIDPITSVLPPNISGFLWHIWNCYGYGGEKLGFRLSNMQCDEAPYRKAQKTEEREVKDEWIKEFYSPENNEEIEKYLPETVVLTISNDGLYEIVRLAIGDPRGR